MSNDRQRGFSTMCLHTGYRPDEHHAARVPPIYQTTAYLFDDADHAARLFRLEEDGYIYSRINNPTLDVFERRMAALEDGDSAVAFASGMAAISATLLTLLRAGDEVAASASLYGGTFHLLSTTLPKLGIVARFADAADSASFEAAITSRTKAVYLETIGNPAIDVPDIAAVAAIAHSHGLPLIVDNTLATPFLCRPLSHGADVAVHSASKFIGGHGAALGGVVVAGKNFDWVSAFPCMQPYQGMASSPFSLSLRLDVLRDYGGALAPLNAFLLTQGLETLGLRMRRHSENAVAAAEFLAAHPAVAYVNYPGQPGHSTTVNARTFLPRGYGALLSFGVKGGFAVGREVVNRVKLAMHLANLGDTRTLIIHPASTTHEQLTSAQRADAGVPDELIRLSVGLEDVEDIIADLDESLRAAHGDR